MALRLTSFLSVIFACNVSFGACSENSRLSATVAFWNGVYGEEHVHKLNSDNITAFLAKQRNDEEDAFIMFFANWCRSSKLVKEEFADVSEEMAYTDGYSKVAFGAMDCNGTIANLRTCYTYNITKYPRFLYFKKGNFEKVYPVTCPRTKDHFYTWLVNKGEDETAHCTPSGTDHSAVKTAVSLLLISLICLIL